MEMKLEESNKKAGPRDFPSDGHCNEGTARRE